MVFKKKRGLLIKYVTFTRKKCHPTKKAKTRKTQNGVDKNGKVQKLEKTEKFSSKDCHKRKV